MNERVPLEVLTGHYPIDKPPLDVKPVAGTETDLPADPDGGAADPGVTESAAGLRALRDEIHQLELGGEEAAARRLAVKAWLEQEVHQDLSEELKWCTAYEVEASRRRVLQGQRRELPEHLDPHELRQAGWGFILPEGSQPGLLEALEPLLASRRKAAGPLFKELRYRRGDSARRFLEDRLGQAPGVIDPRRAPYYFLLVGGPGDIPFEFQYQLSIGHAVGRIFFEDLKDYRRYAEAVVRAEREEVRTAKRFALVSVEHRDDPATQRLREHLVNPLAQRLRSLASPWQLELWSADRAYKKDLARLLGGEATPGVLLVACHGLRQRFGAAEQQALQGALVCQDKPVGKAASREHCFAAEDVPASAHLDGLIAFLLACYGAGTPLGDSFPVRGSAGESLRGREILTPHLFLAALPQALLSHGALAVLGHVDRGWTLSFSWLLQGQIQEAAANFEEVLRRLLTGQRLGHAIRPLYRRYAALAAHAAPSVERLLAGEEVDQQELQLLHVAITDARNFILLGDPAVYASGRRVQNP